MQVRGLAVVSILLSLAVAGCTDEAKPSADDDPFQDLPDEPVSDGKGVIRGIVVDEAVQPVVEALVVVTGLGVETTTAEGGAFVFNNLEPGVYFLAVSKVGYAPTQTSTTVVAGVTKPAILKIQVQRAPGTEPRADTFEAEGFIACGIGTPATFHVCPGLNEDRSIISIMYTGSPSVIQVETTWESTQAAGEQLYLVYYFCGDNCDQLADRWSQGNFDDPWVDRTTDVPADDEVAVYASPGGPANGTGVALDQPFYTYATFFYNIEEPDADWTFMEDGSYPLG